MVILGELNTSITEKKALMSNEETNAGGGVEEERAGHDGGGGARGRWVCVVSICDLGRPRPEHVPRHPVREFVFDRDLIQLDWVL